MIAPHVPLLHHQALRSSHAEDGAQGLDIQRGRLLEVQVLARLHHPQAVPGMVGNRAFDSDDVNRRISQ